MTRSEMLQAYDRLVVQRMRATARLVHEHGGTRDEVAQCMREVLALCAPQRDQLEAEAAAFFGDTPERPEEVEVVRP